MRVSCIVLLQAGREEDPCRASEGDVNAGLCGSEQAGTIMPFVNFAKREVSFKIVYYGPPLSGKTTNLEYLHRVMPAEVKGDMTMLSTREDRTLYFDFLPLESKAIKGFVSRFQLYTVPGQPIYDQTRRIVLSGSDGLVFVADSQWDCMESNVQSFQNLHENLKTYNRKLEEVPFVLEFNKRDVPDPAPVEYLDFLFNRGKERMPHFETVATVGTGVIEALNTVCKMVLASFIEQHRASLDGLAQGAEGTAGERTP